MNYDHALHALASALTRAILRRRPAPSRQGKVTILLMHAWGMGGTIRSTLNLAGYLAERHEVEVLSLVRRRAEPFFEFPPGVDVTAIDDQRPRRLRGSRRLLRRALGAFPSVLLHPDARDRHTCTLWTDLMLVRRLRRVRSGVLIGTRPAFNLLALEAACLGVTVIGVEHMHYSAHTPLMRETIRRRYPRLDGLVVLTEHDLREYGKLVNGDTRLVQIPNAAPQPRGPRPTLTEPVVLAAGRLTPQKGFDRLIDAFAAVAREHPGWMLHICGRGPQRDALQRRIVERDLADRVILMGPIAHLEEQMAKASLFVLSSRYEGLPMVMLEAMRKGLPVVSFDCPTGPGEVIEPGVDGILVPDGDVPGLAEAMLALVADAGERRRLGTAAALKGAAYSPEAVGPRWEDLIAWLTRTGGYAVRSDSGATRHHRTYVEVS
jgi:glycosyltransferase involved in cell wall biosynthesis